MVKKKKIRVYSAFDTPVVDGYDFYDENSPVQQHLRDESDINNIISYWTRTSELPSSRNPLAVSDKANYSDTTVVESYEHALNTILQAEAILDAMPKEMRDRYDDDPINFIQHYLENHSSPKEGIFFILTSASRYCIWEVEM